MGKKEDVKNMIRERFSDIDDLKSYRFTSRDANKCIDKVDITIRDKAGVIILGENYHGISIVPYMLVKGYKVIGIPNEFIIGRQENDGSITLFDEWDNLIRDENFSDVIIEKINKWVELHKKR